jgi:CheY-like chemotaxis protein
MSNRILIVDDERNVRLNLRTALETEGYEVVEAGSGQEGLRSLAEHLIALAIRDIRMPGMDGLELLAKMRENEIRVPATNPLNRTCGAFLRWTTSVPVRGPSTLEANEVDGTSF